MELILWRHAEAEEGLADLERRLTAKGQKQAERMARWLNARLPEDCSILSSPAARALQTAKALGRPVQVVAAIAPGARSKDILDAAGWPGTDCACVVVAGHQPTLGEVAAQLLGADGSLAIRKAGVWWFSSGSRVVDHAVMLRAAMTPDLLKAVAD